MLYLLIAAIIAELAIMPIKIFVYGYFDGAGKRLFFSVRPFDLFNVFGGYIEIEKRLFIVHYKADKAFAFGLFDGGAKIRLKSLKGVLLTELSVGIDAPLTDGSLKFAIVGNFIANELFWLKSASGYGTKMRFETEIGKSDVLKGYIKASVVFNAVIALIVIIGAKRKKRCKKMKE